MAPKARSFRPAHATVVAYLALFVALGGSSYAAIKVTGKNVKDSSLSGKDVKNNSLTAKDVKGLGSADVKDSSLLARDFRAGQLPVGARGATGPKGAKGDTGTVDASGFYSKSASDARFLATDGTAADSSKLDGLESSSFLKATATAAGSGQNAGPFTILDIEGLGGLRAACGNPAQPTVSWLNTSGSEETLAVDDGGPTPSVSVVADQSSAGGVTGSAVVGEGDHVVYMVRGGALGNSRSVWVDVFDAHNPSTFCAFYARAYGD